MESVLTVSIRTARLAMPTTSKLAKNVTSTSSLKTENVSTTVEKDSTLMKTLTVSLVLLTVKFVTKTNVYNVKTENTYSKNNHVLATAPMGISLLDKLAFNVKTLLNAKNV
jgi:hypothetical protein